MSRTKPSRRARDLMRTHFITASPDESLRDARGTMRLARLRDLPVARDGVFLGLLSYRGVLEAILQRLDRGGPREVEAFLSSLIGGLLGPSPQFVSPETDLAEAASQMLRSGIACIPVVEADRGGPRLVGLVTESDLLRAAYERR